MKTFFAEVIENTVIAKDTHHITFRVDDDVTFVSGQFVNLKLPNPDTTSSIPFVMRGYSLASSPKTLPEFTLCVKVVKYFDIDPETGENIGSEKRGIGSGFLGNVRTGDRVEFVGPFGHFMKKHTEKNTVLCATGTGIAPMRAICEDLAEDGFVTKTKLLYGVSHSEFLCYHDYFQALAEKYKNFEYIVFISRETQENIQSLGNAISGRITKGVEALSIDECTNTDFLLCGNPAMVKEVRKLLREEKKVEKSDIVTEQY